MQTLVTKERVILELRRICRETLRADEAAVTEDSSFVKDLGAESLDFLDINYRVEQAFGIKTARHFFLEHVEEMFGEGTAIDDEGRLTPKAVELLKSRYTGGSLPDLSGGIGVDEVPQLITVGSMADAVLSTLETLPEACPACGAKSWKTDDGTHIVCGGCGAAARFVNGDELIKQWLTRVQDETRLFDTV